MAQMIQPEAAGAVGTNLGWAIAGLVRSILETDGVARAEELHRAVERVELELGTGVRPPIRGLIEVGRRSSHWTSVVSSIAADHAAALLWTATLDGDAWALATSSPGLGRMPAEHSLALSPAVMSPVQPEVAAVVADTADGAEHPRGFNWAALESSPAQLTAATTGQFAAAFHIDACVTRPDVPATWALAALIIAAVDPFRLHVLDAGAFHTDVEIDRLAQAVARRLIDARPSPSGHTAT